MVSLGARAWIGAPLLACALAIALVLGSIACGSAKESSATVSLASCIALDASACEPAIPSYSKDIAPLLDRDCNRTCHAPGAGPWPLNDYQQVADWSDQLARDVNRCTMPPPDAGALTTSERTLFLNWVACGAPNN